MLAALLPLLWACSDESDITADSIGTLTLTLTSTSNETDETRADATIDPEFYIGTTHLFFYTTESNDEPAVYHRVITPNASASTYLNIGLDTETVLDIYGESNTKAYIYAVSNLPEDIAITETSSINEIREQVLSSDFSDFNNVTSFVMEGKNEVKLDRNTLTMSSNIFLTRSAARISLSVYVLQRLALPEATYQPVIDKTEASGSTSKIKLQLDVYNTVKRGKINGSLELTDDDYTMYSRDLAYKWNYIAKTGWYYYYAHDPIYTYPSDWSNQDNKNLHVTINIPWKRTDTNTNAVTYKTYYYQLTIPVENTLHTIDRNKKYDLKVFLGVLGGTLGGDVVTPDDLSLSYEISDWTDDGTPIKAELDRSHYLVVQDNTFEVFNENSLTFEYQSCNSVEAYVSEISYVSTRYDNDTIYLYKANYDESTNSYKEVSDGEYKDLSDYTSEVRKSKEEDIIKYIDDHVTKDMLTNKPEANDNVDDINGRITLTSEVSEIAEKLYRPVKYTVVVVNGKDHNQIRQTVTITQYPSKYIEFGAGGNVFVNGYYARLVPDAGYTQDSLPGGSIANGDGYKSYNFVSSTYDESNKYYSSTGNDLNTKIDYGTTGENARNYASINSSYEYVRGNINSTTVSFKQTIDVHVTAFSGSDNYFTINNGNDRKYYKIGDPRIGGNFTNMQSHSTSYTYNGNELYEYYIKGDSYTTEEKHGPYLTSTTHYNRYVEPWPDVDKIKVGGTTTSYDEIISPLFKIQSTYGAAVYAPHFKVAQKRCATYQEAGYPAGRWRLPTLAEIAFIVKLQSASVIDLMFNKSEVGYWTCTGSRIIADDSFKYTANYDGTCYVRCVYDLWYWGSDPVKPTHKFYPMPTKQ
jgi:hypothetical protein